VSGSFIFIPNHRAPAVARSARIHSSSEPESRLGAADSLATYITWRLLDAL